MPQDQRNVSVTHHVKNFDAWLKVYDGEGKDTRGCEDGTVDRAMSRGIEDTNMVSVVFVITQIMAKAKARVASPELKKETMRPTQVLMVLLRLSGTKVVQKFYREYKNFFTIQCT